MTKPREELKQLEHLVGKWKVSGPDISGTIDYRWMEGNHFLIQNVDLEQYGQHVKGFEVIGFEQGFGQEEPSTNITSRYFDNNGYTFDYTYEVNDTTLTIWGGEKGSPAYYQGKWNEDFTCNRGAWVYPNDGGYDSTMEKIAD